MHCCWHWRSVRPDRSTPPDTSELGNSCHVQGPIHNAIVSTTVTYIFIYRNWWQINMKKTVKLRRARLVLRWAIVSGSIPGDGHLFQYVTNQTPKANSAFHPSGVCKWVPASAGKAGMVHSVSGCTRGVQVKLWDPSRTRAIPEWLRGVITTRRYTTPCLPLPLQVNITSYNRYIQWSKSRSFQQ